MGTSMVSVSSTCSFTSFFSEVVSFLGLDLQPTSASVTSTSIEKRGVAFLELRVGLFDNSVVFKAFRMLALFCSSSQNAFHWR